MREIFSINDFNFQGRVNEHGQPVKRNKESYPYSYDGFVTYRGGDNKEANCTIYSDRIHCEKKYVDLCKKHFKVQGQLFFQRTPVEIENFFKDYYDDPTLKLILVMEYCNVSSGFPLWRFDLQTKF